jgi:hypothetical protein
MSIDVMSFDDNQKEAFRLAAADYECTSTGFVLETLLNAIHQLGADPELDPSCFGDEQLRKEVLALIAVSRFIEMKKIVSE